MALAAEHRPLHTRGGGSDMTDRLLAPAAMAALLCLTTAAALAQTPGAMNAEKGWSAIARCAQEDTERARHTCLDRVLREAGLLTEEMHARQQRNAFGLEAPQEALNRRAAERAPAAAPPTSATPPTSPAAPNAATPPAPAARPPVASAPPPQPDQLEVELAKVEKAVNGRLFVTTTEGAVWLQSESVDMPQPPVAGDRMTIRKGSLGGYRCSIASTHLTYRCARNR
jgi:hypothetical protein